MGPHPVAPFFPIASHAAGGSHGRTTISAFQHSLCPRDHAALAPVGENRNASLGCGTCGGLWITKQQLEGRIGAPTVHRLFHKRGGCLTSLRCPDDGGLLWESDIQGVLIDRCTRTRNPRHSCRVGA